MNEKGLTIIEILIGMTVSVIILMVSTSMMANIFYIDTKSKQSEILSQVKNDLQSEITVGVRWAETLSFSDNELVVDSNVYSLNGGLIEKNGEAITPSSVYIEELEVNDFSTMSQQKSLRVNIAMRHRDFTSVSDSLEVVVSQRKMEITEE